MNTEDECELCGADLSFPAICAKCTPRVAQELPTLDAKTLQKLNALADSKHGSLETDHARDVLTNMLWIPGFEAPKLIMRINKSSDIGVRWDKDKRSLVLCFGPYDCMCSTYDTSELGQGKTNIKARTLSGIDELERLWNWLTTGEEFTPEVEL